MTHSTVLTFTRQDLNAAITAAYAKATTVRQYECIDHAAAWIAKFNAASWTLHTNYIDIRSESTPRMYRLELDTLHCTCPSTKPCWHIALGYILCKAGQVAQPSSYANPLQDDIDWDYDNGASIQDAANTVLFGGI